MPSRTLVLASASPARAALLRAAGFAPRVMVSGVDEDGVDGLDAAAAARALAERKAGAVAARLTRKDAVVGAPSGTGGAAGHREDTETGAAGTSGLDAGDPAPVVVGCDSLLAVEGEVRGKPSSVAEATRWWRGYRGREGALVTGHAVVDLASARRAAGVAATVVRFGRPTDAEIDAYIATGEPLAVAGGFTLDGYGAPFVDGVDGDPGTVVGLSLPLLRRLLGEVGVDITTLWVPR